MSTSNKNKHGRNGGSSTQLDESVLLATSTSTSDILLQERKTGEENPSREMKIGPPFNVTKGETEREEEEEKGQVIDMNDNSIIDNNNEAISSHKGQQHSSSSSSSSNESSDETKTKKRRRRSTTNTSTTDMSEAVELEYDPPIITPNGLLDVAAASLNSHLLCSLCCGYYREPYTITECFHTFCKSCIFATLNLKYLRCPTCKISLEPDPYKVVISDRTMQELVMKLFPHLQEQDDEQEKQFYQFRGIKKKMKDKQSEDETEVVGLGEQQRSYPTSRTKSNNKGDNNINNSNNKSLSTTKNNSSMTNLGGCTNPNDKRSSKYFLSKTDNLPLEEILFVLLPDKHHMGYRRLPLLQSQAILTSGRLKVGLLRKYILNKLIALDKSFNDVNPSLVEILCCGDPLGDELSVTFVHKTRWVHSSEFTLTYRILDERG